MDNTYFFFLRGEVVLQSSLNLHELGALISQKILCSLALSGIDDCIYEEIPAIYCRILGLQIVLSHQELNTFIFSITPKFIPAVMEIKDINLNQNLCSLFKEVFKQNEEVNVIPRCIVSKS